MKRLRSILASAALALAALPAAAAKLPASDLQILLDRAGFSCGEIDGRAGGNTLRALAAFQSSAGLRATGRLDERTEQALREAAGPGESWVSHTITADDVAGPFVKVPRDMMEKAELEELAYESPLERLAEAFHVSQRFLKRRNPGARFAAGETIAVPNVGSAGEDEAPRAASVEISRSGSRALARDGEGRIIFFAPTTSGSRHDPLPIGDWKVTGISKRPSFFYNPDLFWDADPDHAKAKLPPGPNNPVGLVWIDIDKPHYGIHGTAEPEKVGHAQSHGCVRLTNWDALRLASMVATGTPVKFVP